MVQRQEAKKRKPCYILATDNDSDLLAITDMLFADKAEFCYAERLSQLLILLERITRQVVIIDLNTWGINIAKVLSEHVRSKAHHSCICLVTEEQTQEIRSHAWSGHLYLVAKERLAEELPVALRQFSETQRLCDQTEDLLRLQQQSLYNTLSREADQMKLEDMNIFKKHMTRRSFLKGAAATAAAAGVVVSGGGNLLSPLVEAAGDATAGSGEQVFQGVCRGGCGGNCSMNVHVRNGKLVKTSRLKQDEPTNERICQRGLTHVQRVYGAERLKYPMRRVGERGSGQWEQMEWDEAIKYICDKWKGYRAQYGDTSIAYMPGGGNQGLDMHYYWRLFNAMGSVNINANYDAAILDISPMMFGYGAWYAGNYFRSIRNSKYIFAWGCNLTEAFHVYMGYIHEAMDNGAKLIVIDPNYTIAASKADKYVPIRPATDGALAMAMINIVAEEGLQDDATLTKGSVAPFLVKDSDGKYLRLSDLGRAETGSDEDAIVVMAENGTVGLPHEIETPVLRGRHTIQGHKVTTAYELLIERCAEWTPERASQHCDIPVDTIYELARMFAEGPTTMYVGYGVDHYGNAPGSYQAMFSLLIAAGQIGKEGAGIGGGIGFNLGLCFDYSAPILYPGMPGPVVHSPLLLDVIETGKYGDLELPIKSIYVYGCNVIASQADRKSWLEVFNKMEFVVVADPIMSDSARYADVVLPVCHYFETVSCVQNLVEHVRINEKALEPLHQSKSDFDITNLLGLEMGYTDLFPVTVDEYFTAVFDNPTAAAFGVSWEALKEQKGIYGAAPGYIHGADYQYPTETGRAQFYLENPWPNAYYGQEFDAKKMALPQWEPPFEAWNENPLFEKYPLIYMSERSKFKAHSQFSHNPWLLELYPEPVVTLNTDDAAARGIGEGDTVRIFNDRGYVVLKAILSAGNRSGTVMIDQGWLGDQFIDGHYTDLTSRKVHPFITNNYYYDTLCQVEKV